MTPARLAEIRKAIDACPRAWDDRGIYVIQPGVVRAHGATAIEHRRELLHHIDELTRGNNP